MAEDFEVGQSVCVAGRGMDAMVHWHGTVEKITKTQIVVKTPGKGGTRRFRRDSGHGSIPYSPYGGTTLESTCQKEKK